MTTKTLADQLAALRVAAPKTDVAIDTSNSVPLAVFVTPSTRTADTTEIRTNGAPPESVLAVLRGAGLRFHGASRAWYGPTRAVEVAVAALAKEHGDPAIGVYPNPAEGIAAWSACPMRTRERKAAAKKRNGAGHAAPDINAVLAEAQQLAQTIGAGLAQAIEVAGLNAGMAPDLVAKLVGLATGPRTGDSATD